MAGKGSAPRNCFSQAFRDNHDAIDWSKGRKPALVVPSHKEVMANPGQWHTLIEGGAVEKLTVAERRTLDKMVKRHTDKCCGRASCTNPATEEHTCPYAEDINNDSTTLCTCCADCQHECAMDI